MGEKRKYTIFGVDIPIGDKVYFLLSLEIGTGIPR
jgi:hypothetical protein